MVERFRRRMSAGGQSWRPRRRLTGCLLWILGLIVVLVILSLMFGGFQKGTKVGGAGVPLPLQRGARQIAAGRR
jgi:hypothetical protein